MSDNVSSPHNQSIEDIQSQSLKRDIFRYLKYWKWILLSAIVSLVVSYVYLRYAPRIYQTNAKIKILKKKDSGLDLSGLTGNTPMFDMSTINLDNELQVLKSRRIIGQVVDNLDLETYYFTTGRVKENELYGSQVPIILTWLDTNDKNANLTKETFVYERVSDESYRLKVLEKSFNKKFEFGDIVNYDNTSFVIHTNPLFPIDKESTNSEIFFNRKTRTSLINRYLSKINAEPVGDDSEIIEIKLSGENIEKDEAILNNLIEVFNEDGVLDDRLIAERTVEFVSEKLKGIESELDTVESNLVDFKKSNDFIDVSGSSVFTTYSEAEQKKSDLQNQIQIAKFIQDEVKQNSQYSLLPGSNAGLQNDNTNNLISAYNSLILERNKELTSSTPTSPQVIKLSDQLNLLKNNIFESIDNYIKSLQISLQNMSSRERQFNSSIKAIPEKEKISREIKRQQAVKENLYIFLLQKQVEAALASAITAPVAKVVDYSYTGAPISPRPNIIYLAGLIIGLAIPIGILYIVYLFDTKVTSKEQVQSRLNVPIVAEIPVNKAYDGKIVKSTDNSNVAEAFRILRTNLNYLLPEDETKSTCRVIFSTSSIKGEGKTFCAINLASVFGSNNSKTLLIGSDLRNPQLHNYLGVSKKNIGLSSYLTNNEMRLKDVIFKNEKNLKFDIILSGEIPPNPSEILNNGRLKEILDEAKEIYDHIIVDTAPTLLVTDTLSIMDHADLVIYMVRANFTELKILRHVNELINFNMKNKVGIGINAIDEKKGYEYNYGYGYGYGADTRVKKWYNF